MKINKLERSERNAESDHLIGLRGLFVLQSLSCVFLLVFAPAIVAHSPNATLSSTPHTLLRLASILFWNQGNVLSGFIFLSARTICVPFMTSGSHSGQSIAGSIFRRGIRLGAPIAVAVALSTVLLQAHGHSRIDNFAKRTGNLSIVVPHGIDTLSSYFNSVFNLFWVTNNVQDQAASHAFPGQMLWVISVIYQQSFTVYMTMVIVPYTHRSWRIKAAIPFIITAWWVQSWACFTITGSIMADAVVNMNFKQKAQRGIKMGRTLRLPCYILYSVIMAVGILLQYRSAWSNKGPREDEGRDFFNIATQNNVHEQHKICLENYLVLVGLCLFVETYDLLQWVLKNPLLLYLGKRSLSFFLVQPIVIYTHGIKLHETLGISNGMIVATCFICVAASEMFHRIVEVPFHDISHEAFDWIRD